MTASIQRELSRTIAAAHANPLPQHQLQRAAVSKLLPLSFVLGAVGCYQHLTPTGLYPFLEVGISVILEVTGASFRPMRKDLDPTTSTARTEKL